VKSIVGTETCQARHVGYVLSGRLGIALADGSVLELPAGTAYDIPPGHDGWTVGDEPVVTLEWTGVREWLGERHEERVLATLLLTDIVDSTATATQLGDRAWRARLVAHDEVVRQVLSDRRGTEVNTTGDGFLARFDGPAQAVEAAVRIRDGVRPLGLAVRQGIHVGEVERRGRDVAGLAVHETARIAGSAEAGEILVSAVARTLAIGSRFTFEPRGPRVLKGVAAPVELFAVA
jgi:class 3 adenylate cyclase